MSYLLESCMIMYKRNIFNCSIPTQSNHNAAIDFEIRPFDSQGSFSKILEKMLHDEKVPFQDCSKL